MYCNSLYVLSVCLILPLRLSCSNLIWNRQLLRRAEMKREFYTKWRKRPRQRFSAKCTAGIPVCEFFSLPMVGRDRSPLQSCVFTSETIHNVTGCCDDKTQPNDRIAIFYCRRQQPNYDQFNCAESISFWMICGRARKRQAALIRSAEAADRFTLLEEIESC